jgi:hypothetical protein
VPAGGAARGCGVFGGVDWANSGVGRSLNEGASTHWLPLRTNKVAEPCESGGRVGAVFRDLAKAIHPVLRTGQCRELAQIIPKVWNIFSL